MHLKTGYGPWKNLLKYVSKEESAVTDDTNHGTVKRLAYQHTGAPAVTPGRRTDIEFMRELIADGADDVTLADANFGTWCTHNRAFQRYRQLTTAPRSAASNVEYHYGDSGTGKSAQAHFRFPNSYPKNNDLWWDMYDGKSNVIMDDYSGGMPLNDMLRILDRYACKVPVKGGYLDISPPNIIITSNCPPEELYQTVTLARREAWLRRLTTVVKYTRVESPLAVDGWFCSTMVMKGGWTAPEEMWQLPGWTRVVPLTPPIPLENTESPYAVPDGYLSSDDDEPASPMTPTNITGIWEAPSGRFTVPGTPFQ